MNFKLSVAYEQVFSLAILLDISLYIIVKNEMADVRHAQKIYILNSLETLQLEYRICIFIFDD